MGIIIHIAMTDHFSQLRLWQLISPALPVGSYAYSGGFESAVENGWITDQQQARQWIKDILSSGLGRLDVPVFSRLYQACQKCDKQQFEYWNHYLLACRESSELQLEDQQMGRALLRLMQDMDMDFPWYEQGTNIEVSYAAMFASAAVCWQITETDAVHGLIWSWCENQVAAAIKLVPLGQTAGQQILSELASHIPDYIEKGLALKDDEIGFTLPGLAIISAEHETQYSRLFRS